MSRELHTPVKRLKSETSSSDFVKYLVFFEEEDKHKMNDHDSTVWHLAQLAEEIVGLPYRFFGKDIPKSLVGTDKFLLKFTTKEEFLKNKKKNERKRKKLDSELSFNVFSSLFGIDPVTMQVKGKPTANSPSFAQNGVIPPVFSPEGVPTPPMPQNKKTGQKSASISIRGKEQ